MAKKGKGYGRGPASGPVGTKYSWDGPMVQMDVPYKGEVGGRVTFRDEVFSDDKRGHKIEEDIMHIPGVELVGKRGNNAWVRISYDSKEALDDAAMKLQGIPGVEFVNPEGTPRQRFLCFGAHSLIHSASTS